MRFHVPRMPEVPVAHFNHDVTDALINLNGTAVFQHHYFRSHAASLFVLHGDVHRSQAYLLLTGLSRWKTASNNRNSTFDES